MKRFFSPFLFILLLLAVPLSQPHAEEGMFPVTEIDKLPLQAWGFQISADQIFSEKHVSLSDAILRNKTFAVTDSLGLSDAVPLTNRTFAIAEQIGLVDNVLRDKILEILDSLGLSDNIVRIKQFIITDK